MLYTMTDKGGCKVGKKAPEGSPKGGCKEGLKAKPKKKLVLRLQPQYAKKKVPPVPSNAQTAKVIAPKKRVPMVAKVMKANPTFKQKVESQIKKYSLDSEKLPDSVKKLVLKEKPKKKLVLRKKPDGINISTITEDKLEIWELVPDDEDSHYLDSMLYMNDLTDVMTRKQSDWYMKKRLEGDFRDWNRKDQDKWEDLEEKIRSGVGNELAKQHTKYFRDWKMKNKGMTGTLEEFKKSFEKFYN
jgi:hypothetical protein